MDQRFITGNFVLAINNEMVVKANRIESCPSGYILDGGLMTIDSKTLTHAWKITGGAIPAAILDERTRIGGAILDMELSAKRYFAETKRDPWVASDSPVIFGAASLALTVINDRTSDDVDFALSNDFYEWRKANWSSLGITNSDTLRFGVFANCGDWRARSTIVEGLEGTTFRIISPLDTVMQKLLRTKSDENKFELKDKGDIKRIISTLKPSNDALVGLLTENHLRYLEPVVETGSRSRDEIHRYQSVKENTEWFLAEYLPGFTFAEIANKASERHYGDLGSLAGRSTPASAPGIATAIGAQRIDDLCR